MTSITHHRKIIKSDHKGGRRMHLKDEWYRREKARSVEGVEKPPDEESSGHRLLAWVI
jgi:hypothetical protein